MLFFRKLRDNFDGNVVVGLLILGEFDFVMYFVIDFFDYFILVD